MAQFLYLEARLADTHDYDGWEALWTDDAIYWVPANGDDTDPEKEMSVLYDNRSRIGVRIRQLKTGRRHTQTPRSELARVISNIEIAEVRGPRWTCAPTSSSTRTICAATPSGRRATPTACA